MLTWDGGLISSPRPLCFAWALKLLVLLKLLSKCGYHLITNTSECDLIIQSLCYLMRWIEIIDVNFTKYSSIFSCFQKAFTYICICVWSMCVSIVCGQYYFLPPSVFFIFKFILLKYSWFTMLLISPVQQSDSVIHIYIFIHIDIDIYIEIYRYTFSYSFPFWFITGYWI